MNITRRQFTNVALSLPLIGILPNQVKSAPNSPNEFQPLDVFRLIEYNVNDPYMSSYYCSIISKDGLHLYKGYEDPPVKVPVFNVNDEQLDIQDNAFNTLLSVAVDRNAIYISHSNEKYSNMTHLFVSDNTYNNLTNIPRSLIVKPLSKLNKNGLYEDMLYELYGSQKESINRTGEYGLAVNANSNNFVIVHPKGHNENLIGICSSNYNDCIRLIQFNYL